MNSVINIEEQFIESKEKSFTLFKNINEIIDDINKKDNLEHYCKSCNYTTNIPITPLLLQESYKKENELIICKKEINDKKKNLKDEINEYISCINKLYDNL